MATTATMSGILQSAYADTGFDIVSANCNDSGEIVITFNSAPAENGEAVYFIDEDGNKIYVSPTVDEASRKSDLPSDLH